MTQNHTDVGSRIKDLRIESGMTQVELAEAVKCDRTYLAHVENGTKNAGRTLIQKIASYFKVSLSYLYEGNASLPLSTNEVASNILVRENDTKYTLKDTSLADSLKMRKEIGRLFFKPESYRNQFGYYGLDGVKLRVAVLEDAEIKNSNLYKLVTSDQLWSIFHLDGWEFEVLRGYYEYGGDRHLDEWGECIRMLRWLRECIELRD